MSAKVIFRPTTHYCGATSAKSILTIVTPQGSCWTFEHKPRRARKAMKEVFGGRAAGIALETGIRSPWMS
jgi:hypothetical protein